MLKLRAPIKTVLNPELISASESFAERIMGNYSQIGVELGQADLLHVTNEPPEIFVMDGGMTNLFTAANVENTQIQKTKIINNLINRIVFSADAGFSYQDNVYVTNILHKLGIKDEKTFLSETQRLFQETREHHQAVSLYWQNLESLQTLIRQYKSESHTEKSVEEKSKEEPVLHLHEEVFNRLQTAAIYRVLQNFYENDTSPRVITNEMMMISEQSRLSREILLKRLREEVRMEPAYLTYRHENYYEGDEVNGDEVTVEDVSTRISSAVLLNLIDNIYDSVYRRVDHHLTNWLSTENTYFGSAENTLYRIEQNTAYLQFLYEQSKSIEENQAVYMDEVSTLQQLLSVYASMDERIQQSIGGNVYDTDITNTYNTESDITNDYLTNLSPTELVHIHGDEIEGDEIQNIHQPASISERIENTYQQNILRNQKYLNALQKIVEQGQSKESSGERLARMQRESRKSLEQPEEFLKEYKEADQRALEVTQTIIRESEKLLSPQQQVAHELIREYLQAPERFYNSQVISEGNLGVLIYDIHEAMQPSETIGSSEDTSGDRGPGFNGTGQATGGITENYSGDLEALEHRFYGVERVFENEIIKDREFTNTTEQNIGSVTNQIILHRDNSFVNQITNRVIERWHERRERPSGFEVTYEEVGTAMVHRSKENTVDEEVIESIQQQIHRMEETQRSVTESTKYQETDNRTIINNIVNETIENNTQTITDIVNTSVRKQLDEISDRVYGKIERQLKNEKRRRGL